VALYCGQDGHMRPRHLDWHDGATWQDLARRKPVSDGQSEHAFQEGRSVLGTYLAARLAWCEHSSSVLGPPEIARKQQTTPHPSPARYLHVLHGYLASPEMIEAWTNGHILPGR
jgi:hypothetical protein